MNQEIIRISSTITIQYVKPLAEKYGKPYDTVRPEHIAQLAKAKYEGKIGMKRIRDFITDRFEEELDFSKGLNPELSHKFDDLEVMNLTT